MATFSNSDPYLAIERALRAARRPSDEGPRARAMWDQYQSDAEPYGNRPWRSTPYEPREPTIEDVEAVQEALGVDAPTAVRIIQQATDSTSGIMNENHGRVLGMLANHAEVLGKHFGNIGKDIGFGYRDQPQKAALTPAQPPSVEERVSPPMQAIPNVPPSLEEIGAVLGRAQMEQANYNPRGVETEETQPQDVAAEVTAIDPQAVAENARQAAIEQSIEEAIGYTQNQARMDQMFNQPQSLLAMLEPVAPVSVASRDQGLGRTGNFASRGLAAASVDPEEADVPGPDMEAGRLAGLAAGVGLPSLAYDPQAPSFDVEVDTPSLAYDPQSPAFDVDVDTPSLAYDPQAPAMPGLPEVETVDVPTPAISYNPEVPGVPEAETPGLAYNPEQPAFEEAPNPVDVPTPEISYNPQQPALPEIDTPEISYSPFAPNISPLERARAIAELEQALQPSVTPGGRYAALTPPTIADVPAISAPVGPSIGTGNWNDFNPSPTVTRAYDPVGSVSAKQESSGKGVGFISHGRGDPGGQSYGVHQLSSRYSMGAFLRSREGAKYAPMFAGLRPGTPAFNQAYKAAVAADPKGMQKAQYDFYTRTHYQPVVEMARKAGFNVNDRGVQEALFSQAIQHSGRGNQSIINAAARGGVGGSAEQQIRKLYNARARYAAQVRMPADWARGVQQRYVREVEDAVRASRQGNATNSAAGGGFDDTSSALGGYTEITGPRTRASLGIPGIINTLLGIPSAAAASAPAQDAPVGFGATTFLPPPTPAAMAPSTPSTASSGLGASQGGQQSSASSSQTSSQSAAQAAAAQAAGLGAMASAPTASAGQAQSQAQAAAKSEEESQSAQQAQAPAAPALTAVEVDLTSAPTVGFMGQRGMTDITVHEDGRISLPAINVTEEFDPNMPSKEMGVVYSANAMRAGPTPGSVRAAQEIGLEPDRAPPAPGFRSAQEVGVPQGPAYGSFRSAQDVGLRGAQSAPAEDEGPTEDENPETTSFSNAFSAPNDFGPMGGMTSGLAGTSLGTAPSGVTGGVASTTGAFGGLGLGQSAVENSQAQMAALGLEGLFSQGFQNPMSFAPTGLFDPSPTTEEGEEPAGPATTAADVPSVDTSPSSQTDGPGTDSAGTGEGSSSSSGDGSGGGSGNSDPGTGLGGSGGMEGGHGGQGDPSAGDTGLGDNSGGFGPSGGDPDGGTWADGGYISDRAILRALRATERMMAREQKSRGGYVMPFARFADGGEIVQKSVEYTPNGVIYSTVIERALNAAKRRRAA